MIHLLSLSLVFAAAFCGFFYSSKLFYESLVAKKRAHSSVYAVRAAGAESSNLMRRANVLGLAGMLLLFVLAYSTLVMLFANTHSRWFGLDGSYSSMPAAEILVYASGTLFGFSFMLVTVASSYTMFKRPAARTAPALLALALAAFLASL